MEFTEQKTKLLEQAQHILSFVSVKDIGLNTIVNILDKIQLKNLEKWYLDVEVFIETYGLNCHKDKLADNSWIINGDRVNISRIKNIMELISNINE